MLNKKEFYSCVFLLIIDLLWLKFYMIDKYKILIKNIQNKEMKGNINSGIISYLLLCVGMIRFVLPQIDEKKKDLFNQCLKTGFIFGVVVYGVYDYTCGAIFEKWDFNLALIDTIWGGILYTISAYLGIIYSKKD